MGFFPDLQTWIIVSLSSLNSTVASLPRILSHRIRAGSPTVRNAKSAATISASGVEWLTHACFFEMAVNMNLVSGPCISKQTPLVLRESDSPAKSASA